jgi:S1-C subfamily serine protease
MDTLSSLNDALATAVDRAASSVVQVQGHRRPAAGVVFAPDMILAPAAALDDEVATVRAGDGTTHEATVLGRAFSSGLAVARVAGVGLKPLDVAAEPKIGHLAIAVGRTWSGGVMATLTNVAVIGGPLRTGRATQLDRVIRIAQPPHGALTGGALIDGSGRALGIVTGRAIRGTTVVIPAALAWTIGQQTASQGGAKQGYLGISSFPVRLPAAQRGGREQSGGLLVNGIVDGGPAAVAGVLVGDVILAFDGKVVDDPETLLTLLRGDRIPRAANLTVARGGEVREVPVTVGERALS